MWTRKELKEQGKISFKANYWKSVIVALLLSMIVGGGAGVSSFSNGISSGMNAGGNNTSISSYNYDGTNPEELDELEDLTDPAALELILNDESIDLSDEATAAAIGVAAVVGFAVFMFVFIVIMAIVLVVNAFIINPFTVGAQRFFVKNLDEPATVSNLGYGFDNNYKNIAITMFFRDLYTILWGLLFIIPGIVKAYEYRMIPYLMADDPTMTKEQAFAISKEMMTGNKWKAFVLDLSFLGWHILSLFTMGILEIFYVAPYQYATNAALYRKLLTLRSSDTYAYQPVYETAVVEENQTTDEL